jgi:tetratricopeptide (TPR) repeat protein
VALLFALGLMCKPMLVTLPVVLLLLDYWPLQRVEPAGRLVLEKMPLLALSAASCIVTVLAQTGAIQSAESFSPPLRFANALVTCMVYLGQMVWPAGLAVFYPHPLNRLPAWEVVLAGMLLAGLSAVALGRRRKEPWLLIGWCWYLVMLLPAVGIIQVGKQAHADRYTYLPQIGIYVAVTWLVAEWRLRWLHHGSFRVALWGLMMGVLALLMVCAWQQTAYWQNSETLWTHTLSCTTDNEMAHNNLGNDLLQKGRVDDAISQYQMALQIKPNYAEAHNNLGNALPQKGRVDDAISQCQMALQIKPDYAEAHNNLGNALLQKGSVDDAISQYQTALQIRPDYVEAHNNLGNAFLQKGSVAEAISQFQQALQIKPDYAEACNNLGNALFQKGRMDEAIAHYQQAAQIKPGFAEARNNLGSVLSQKGRTDEAITQFQQALQIKPAFAEAHNNLGGALGQKGRVDEAITQFQQALQINPAFAEAHYNLGNALRQKGRVEEAITHYQQALQIEPGNPKLKNLLEMKLYQAGSPFHLPEQAH